MDNFSPTSSLASRKVREATDAYCILPQQVFRGAKLDFQFPILEASRPLASELVLKRRTREFDCVVVIFGDGELSVLHQSYQLDVEVFHSASAHPATLRPWV